MFFVYYEDDYADCGGYGLEECETEEAANGFIMQRLSAKETRHITSYTVIEGSKKIVTVTSQSLIVQAKPGRY